MTLISGLRKKHASFVTSSAIAQLFPLVSAPIVLRLYSLEDFGIYAVFYALLSILGGISSLSLQNATLLQKHGFETFFSTTIALTATFGFSLLVFIALLAIPSEVQRSLLGENVLPYLVWLPLSVIVSGSFNCVYTWAVRHDLFDVLARNKLIMGAATMFLQIGIGTTDPGPVGFILANLTGQLLALVLIGRYFIRDIPNEKHLLSVKKISVFIKRHWDLIVWTTPASLVNYLGNFLPDMLINKFFGLSIVGQYSMANRMVNFPLAFVSTSLRDLFRQQAAEELDSRDNCKQSFNRFFILASLVSLFFIIPIAVLAPYIFPIVFGAKWDQAGSFVQATVVLTIVRFVSSPLSFVWILRGYEKLNLMWQIGLVAIIFGCFVSPNVLPFEDGIILRLTMYSFLVGAWYVLCIIMSQKFSYRNIRLPAKSV